MFEVPSLFQCYPKISLLLYPLQGGHLSFAVQGYLGVGGGGVQSLARIEAGKGAKGENIPPTPRGVSSLCLKAFILFFKAFFAYIIYFEPHSRLCSGANRLLCLFQSDKVR